MTIKLTTVADDVVVSGQISPSDFPELARLGIRSVINNRPDGEGGSSQPSASALHAAADTVDIFYADLPVASLEFDARTISRMRALVGELPRPVLAFCGSGKRSAALYYAAHPEMRTLKEPLAAKGRKGRSRNVGGIDRAARITFGAALVGATLSGAVGDWGWLGLVPLATGLLRFCPAYLPFGISTVKR